MVEGLNGRKIGSLLLPHNRTHGFIFNPVGHQGGTNTRSGPSFVDQPLVTVIIPSYNHADFIGQAIDSVAGQTYKNIELIIIDDGSRDGSPSVIEDVIKKYKSISMQLLVQENSGAHKAINRGILLAKGEYIAILNSDDYYYPNRIERLISKAKRDGCEFIFSKVEHVSSDGGIIKKAREKSLYISAYERARNLPTLGPSLLSYNLAVTTSNFFLKKSLIDKVGLFHAYKAVHDWDYLLRVLRETEPCILDEPLVAYRLHGHNSIAGLSQVGERETRMVLWDYARILATQKAGNKLAPVPPGFPRRRR